MHDSNIFLNMNSFHLDFCLVVLIIEYVAKHFETSTNITTRGRGFKLPVRNEMCVLSEQNTKRTFYLILKNYYPIVLFRHWILDKELVLVIWFGGGGGGGGRCIKNFAECYSLLRLSWRKPPLMLITELSTWRLSIFSKLACVPVYRPRLNGTLSHTKASDGTVRHKDWLYLQIQLTLKI